MDLGGLWAWVAAEPSGGRGFGVWHWVALWMLGPWILVAWRYCLSTSVVQWQCIVFDWAVLVEVKAVFGFASFRYLV